MLSVGIFSNGVQCLADSKFLNDFQSATDVSPLLTTFSNLEDTFKALNYGTIQAAAVPLKNLPTALPNGIVITALSGRNQNSFTLLIKTKALNTENKTQFSLWDLAPDTKIVVGTPLQKAQWLHLKDDINVEISDINPSEYRSQLASSAIDGVILPTEIIETHFKDDVYKTLSFNPKEFVTEGGQGVVAYLTIEDDFSTRRLLKKLHQPNTTVVTNIERSLKKQFNDTDIAAYCEMDSMNYYHLWAAAIVNGAFKTTRLSQSTSFELVENCYKMLSK